MMNLRSAALKTTNRKPLSFSLHSLAILSICVYIICSVVFEYTKISLPVVSSYALYFCLGCCALSCLAKGKISCHWALLTLLALGMLIWISCLYTPASERYTSSNMYRYWTSLILCFLIVSVKPTEKEIFKIVYAFIIAGVLLAIYIYSFYGINTLISFGDRLANGDFGNVNVIGMYCAFSVVLSIYAMLWLKKNKFLCIAATVICLPCIFFTGSRKALLSVLVCILALVFITSKNTLLIRNILIAIGAIILIVWAINAIPAFEPIKERLFGLFGFISGNEASVAGDENRVVYIIEGLKAFLKKPLFGNGFCYSYYVFNTYTHNNYVELLMCHGIVGLITYYSVFVGIILVCRKKQLDDRIKALVYIIAVKVFIEDIGTVSYYNRMMFVIIAVLISCSCLKECNDNNDLSKNTI